MADTQNRTSLRLFRRNWPCVVVERKGIPLYFQSRHCQWRRYCDGVACGCQCGECGIRTISSHLFVSPTARNFLISEALQGAGGLLKRTDGTRFMLEYDERAELAPRDIVARSIDAELKKSGAECVYLDMMHLSRDELQRQFPNIYEGCYKLGIDIATQMIPVVPAAHYFCGRLAVDLNGETNIRNLFSIETSCTGLHGANRLASNSLLETQCFHERSTCDVGTIARFQST